jgi:hypothetical protein
MRKLRCVIRAHRRLKPWLKRCRHCGIIFLTHPRNANRNDIGCPFGCRQARRSRKSTERSTAYYRTAQGKIKKQQQNARRGNRQKPLPPEPDQTVIVHLKMVTSLVEGRAVAFWEVFAMVRRILRQHSIGWPAELDYNLPNLDNPPP